MPLFYDPQRRRHYRSSSDHGELQQQVIESPRYQSDENTNLGLESTKHAAIFTVPSTSEQESAKLWTNDRQELIQRIKESSPWRLQYMVSWTFHGLM